MPAREEYVAYGKTNDEICQAIGADWLIYQDLGDLVDACTGTSGSQIEEFDCSCFNGIYVTGGILEVQPHRVTILADSATHSEELDEEAALQAKNQAEEALKGADKKEDLEQAQAQLVEAAARYSAVKKLKGRK